MGTGYTRTDVANNIANGKVADADDLDAEFNAIDAAFNEVSGHTHDGTADEGAPITVVGPAQEYVANGTAFYPKSDDTYNLGTSSLKWKDLYVDGVGYFDSAEISGGSINGAIIGATAPAAITGTTITGSSFVGPLTGNASTATTLATARNFNLAGDVTAPAVSFNGSGNVTLTTTVVNDSHNHTLSTITDAGTMAAQNATSVAITGGTMAGINITGGNLNNTPIGAVTASSGRFTNLFYSGSLNDGSTNLTATLAELNTLDGITSTTTQLNYLNTATDNIQTQLNAKQPLDATLTDFAAVTWTAGKVVVTDGTDSFTGYNLRDQDDMAANDAAGIPTQQSVKAYVDALPITSEYISSEQTITSGGLLTLAHGLGAVPKIVQTVLVCITADAEYSVGDILVTTDSSQDTGIATVLTSTNISIRYSSAADVFSAFTKITGVNVLLKNTHWRLVVKAWA